MCALTVLGCISENKHERPQNTRAIYGGVLLAVVHVRSVYIKKNDTSETLNHILYLSDSFILDETY